MNHIAKVLLALLIIMNLTACTKDDGYIEDLNEKGLTTCPDNFSCKYLYMEDADITQELIVPAKGNFRVFYNEFTTNSNTRTIFIKAPMRGDTFSLNDDDMKNGKALYFDNCALCFSIPVKVLGGSCKGRKINTNTANGTERWLLETTFKLSSTVFNGEDTLHIKQYYYLKSGV
jgi:hypothetical protein